MCIESGYPRNLLEKEEKGEGLVTLSSNAGRSG